MIKMNEYDLRESLKHKDYINFQKNSLELVDKFLFEIKRELNDKM